ncbi:MULTISPECIES: hypothetical protein [Aliarcobacter]|uniref:hypothetical protein n=1 Tax=Aliarcobacter TaxID=2321111 RepID=UPI0015E8609B|nr:MULTISPECIES: hypothetical protein [Aliarcobacter]
MINSYKSELLILFFIYLISNIFLLLNFNAIYWDDWVWFYQDDISFVYEAFDQLKLGYKGDFFLFLMNIDFYGGYPFRVFVFISSFISGLCLYYIISKVDYFDKHSRFFIVLFFLVAPLYSSKMIPSIAQFYLPVMFYFIGFATLVKFVHSKNVLYRIFALILFTLSFSTNSVLVFYFIIFIFLYYFHFNSFNGILEFIKNMLLISKKYIDFLLIPFLYYIYKSIYMVPFGLYDGYNSVSLLKMIDPIKYLSAIENSFFEPIFISIKLIYPIVPVIIFVIFIINRIRKNKIEQKNQKYLILFILGVIIFVLGSMPYIAVDKMPTMHNMNSRFQILLSLGFSIMLYYIIMLIFANKVKIYILSILCLSFVLFHIKDQLLWNIDWQYQQSIQENFKTFEIVKNNSTFVVINNLGNKLYNERRQSFYELNGISKKAFGDDKRFFVNNINEINSYKKYREYKHYNFSSWIDSQPITIYFVDALEKNVGYSRKNKLKFFIKLKYLELFNKEKYRQEVSKLVEIK